MLIYVDPAICLLCGEEKNCHYFHGDNDTNLTFLVANPDGSCQVFKPSVELLKEDEMAENS